VASNGDTTFDMCNYTTMRTFFHSKSKQYCKERPPWLKIAMTLKKELAEDQASRIKSNPEKGYQPRRRPVLFRHRANAHLVKTRRMQVSGICKKKREGEKIWSKTDSSRSLNPVRMRYLRFRSRSVSSNNSHTDAHAGHLALCRWKLTRYHSSSLILFRCRPHA
jgi:hypothetical protein